MFVKVSTIKCCSLLKKLPINLIRQCSTRESIQDNDFKNWKEKLRSTMTIYPNFITNEEEKSLLNEVEPYLKRMRYEYSHWDDRIHGYRETEFTKWNENNIKIINKVRELAFPRGMSQLKFVHVLDLAENGWIKPHVDSTRYCGEVIATMSLLSDCIMRLTYVDHETDYWDDFLIPRRSLYVMNGLARYKYNHEVLSKEKSLYNGKIIEKTRRISIICRSEPESKS